VVGPIKRRDIKGQFPRTWSKRGFDVWENAPTRSEGVVARRRREGRYFVSREQRVGWVELAYVIGKGVI